MPVSGNFYGAVNFLLALLIHDGGPYHKGTRPLIYRANQWTGFFMMGTSVMKELKAIMTFFGRLECGDTNFEASFPSERNAL